MRTLAVLAVLSLLATPSFAGKLSGVELPDRATVSGDSVELTGMALRKKFFVKVYVAGLYLPSKGRSGDAVLAADEPRRLVMEFLREVGKGSLCDAWNEGLEANRPEASAGVKGQFETLCWWMVDVDEGDRFVFTYTPDEGTVVEVVGDTKEPIPGKEFADALFSSWIGPVPGPGEAFKEDLLGL